MTGRLALFANDKGGNDKAPDAKGVGEIDGVKVEAAAWWRTSKAGQRYLSVTIAPPRERQPEPPARPQPRRPRPSRRRMTSRFEQPSPPACVSGQ